VGRQFRAESLSMKIAALTGKTVYHRINGWLKMFIYGMTVAAFGFIAFAARRNKGIIQ
jgi:apolipoprotein N-acyltransferase